MTTGAEKVCFSTFCSSVCVCVWFIFRLLTSMTAWQNLVLISKNLIYIYIGPCHLSQLLYVGYIITVVFFLSFNWNVRIRFAFFLVVWAGYAFPHSSFSFSLCLFMYAPLLCGIYFHIKQFASVNSLAVSVPLPSALGCIAFIWERWKWLHVSGIIRTLYELVSRKGWMEGGDDKTCFLWHAPFFLHKTPLHFTQCII